MKKVKVISCVLTLGIMALIFWFSSQNSAESADVSKGFSMWILNMLPFFSHMSYDAKLELAQSMDFFIRKTAHFSIYAALGMSSAAAMHSISGKAIRKILIFSVLLCMLYAVSDEIHQEFVSGRAGRAGDVLIDTAGAFTGVLLLMFAAYIIRRLQKKVK